MEVKVESTDDPGYGMEWNQNNLNGAIAPPRSQQYFLPSTSSMAANGQMQSSSLLQNSVQNGSYNLNKRPLLQNLLTAQTTEDFFKAQQTVLGNFKNIQPIYQTNQMKSSLPVSSYKPAQESVPIPDNRSALQNTVGSNCRMSAQVNSVHIPQQQSTVVAGQQFGGNGYNTTAVQQHLQNSQVLQNYQPTVTYSYPQQNDIYSSLRPPTNPVHIPCQQVASNVPPTAMYNFHNGVSGQLVSPQKLPAETNVSAPMQICSNNQNITNPSLAKYSSLAPSMLPHGSQQQVSVQQNLPQLDGNANCYTQSKQRQNLTNISVNSTPQILSATAAKMPPSYSEALTNMGNVYSISMNENFTKQRKNYIAPNEQQPVQTGDFLPVQSSVGSEQSGVHDIALQMQHQDVLKLLLVYQKVKKKYELLNRENNLLRRRLHTSTSREIAVPPPLLSSLSTTQPPSNCVMAGQQNVMHSVPGQNAAQMNSVKAFQGQNICDNLVNATNQTSAQHNMPLQESAEILNQMFKSDNGNHLGQNDYSVFDGGQGNVANGSSSALQSLNSETLTTKACQDVTSRAFMRWTYSNNQFMSRPNINNGNVLQNGHGLPSPDKPALVTQSLNPSCQEKNGYEHLSSYKTAVTGQATSTSREAIEASLPLWKAVPQNPSSVSANRSSETQNNLSPLAALRLLEEITLEPTNEVSSTVPAQKQESVISNQANPQIAIVSPLVQSKEALYDDYQVSKVHMQGPHVENATNNLINSHEADCINKILQALKSLDANSMNNMEDSKSKEHSVASQDNVASSLPSSIEASSQMEQKNVEILEDSLQISGICTLVEGNSLYDSSIAKIFDETSDATALSHTDTRDGHCQTDASCVLKVPCSTSPNTVTVAIKSEPVANEEAVGQTLEGDLGCKGIPCIDMQADKPMVPVQQESCCDVESSAISDQLTELLTEFPYGIKNYRSEGICESTNGQLVKMTNKPVLKGPEDFEPVDENKAIGDAQSELVPSSSVNLNHKVEMDSEPLMEPSAEKLCAEMQQTTESVPMPDIDVDGGGPILAINTCSNDGFEILSDSPVSGIKITLLDPHEIPNIFPDKDEHGDSEKCNETILYLQKCANTKGPETSHPLKKESADMTEAETDKNLFCCLFSWLTHTNRNAPKCNCKLLESSKEIESPKLNDSLILKADPSPQSSKPTLQGLTKPKDAVIGFEILQPSEKPPKLDLVDSDNEEILRPMDKPPKLERILSLAAHSQKSSTNFTPQAERVQPVKSCLMKINPVRHEKSLKPSPLNGEPTFEKSSDQFPAKKFKSHGSRKSEKLIVKTDFLKNKRSYKEKRKIDKKNASCWTFNKSGSPDGFLKNLQGEPEKRTRGEERVRQNRSTVKVNQTPDDQQAGKHWKRQKSYPGVDRSDHTPRVEKRKERESHFEKSRKVPTVQEYLERKRELCKKRTEVRTDQRECLEDLRRTAERPPEMSGNPHLKRRLSPAKTNVTSKENTRHSETPKGFYQKDRAQSRNPYEAGQRKLKDSYTEQRVSENKPQNLRVSLSKDKIYLSPCVGPRHTYEGTNLAKLQIRHSPDKPKCIERRQSLESSTHTHSAVKSVDPPKMLEFKLYPDFAHENPNTQDQAREATDPKAKSVIEGIKSRKEAWYNSIPLKKRRMENVEGKGFHKLPSFVESTMKYKPLEKNSTRPPQDSRTTFNVFKQRYHEQRSKSLDCSQGSS